MMDRVRMDKWLWAARFFKTRTLAARVLAAIGIRESGFRSSAVNNGMYGIFQINIAANNITAAQAQNTAFAANIAASNLSLFLGRFSSMSAEYGIDPLVPALANYDGVLPSKISGAILGGAGAEGVDKLTDPGNYADVVLAIARNCFQ
jgi:hypothetical protein